MDGSTVGVGDGSMGALHEAVANADLASVRRLLSPATAATTDGFERTPLHIAASIIAPAEVTETLIQLLVDAHWPSLLAVNRAGYTPLLCARTSAAASSLVASGGEESAADTGPHGEVRPTPSQNSCSVAHYPPVSVPSRPTPFHIASHPTASRLRPLSIPLAACPIQSLLHVALLGNAQVDPDLISAAIRVGVPVDIADNNGRTPLHLAAAGGHTEVVRMLIGAAGSRLETAALCSRSGMGGWEHAP